MGNGPVPSRRVRPALHAHPAHPVSARLHRNHRRCLPPRHTALRAARHHHHHLARPHRTHHRARSGTPRQQHQRQSANTPHPQGSTHSLEHPQARPNTPPTRRHDPAAAREMRRLGAELPDRRHRWCETCRQAQFLEQANTALAKAQTVLAQLRAEQADPARLLARRGRPRGTTQSAPSRRARMGREQRRRDGTRGARESAQEWEQIRAELQHVPIGRLVEIRGLSPGYCSLVLGKRVRTAGGGPCSPRSRWARSRDGRNVGVGRLVLLFAGLGRIEEYLFSD